MNEDFAAKPARRRFLCAALGASALGTAWPVWAQSGFPSRPVRVIPFGTAGGPIDAIARLYAEKLQQRWSQPLVVEAKPGASGIIAADAVAKAAPDGYTALITLSLTHINNAILHEKLPYDPVKDFQPVSMIGTGSPMLVARADAPYDTLDALIQHAKKSAKGLTFGTWGNGSMAHLFGERLRANTGTQLIHVAYKSESGAHSDLYGGVLDFAWANPSTASAAIQSKRMKALGVAGTQRLSILPQVPTFGEQGYAGFETDSWIGVYLPANTPQPIVDAWVSAMREITAMPEIANRLVSYGFEPLGNTPAQFKARYERDFPQVEQLIRAAGVTVS